MALIVGGTTVTGTQTLDATKLTGNLPAISGASLTSLNGSQVSSGTVAAARIANLAASKITSGTMDGARISGGTLGATNGSNLTSLPAPTTIPQLSSGAVSSFGFLHVSETVNNGNTFVSGNYGNNNDQYRGHWSSSNNNHGSLASGTWRAYGNTPGTRSTLFQRVS